MGMGKTSITLDAINELMYHRFAVNRVLVIAPKKVAEATWQAEGQKWDEFKSLRFSTVLGTPKQREAALATPADIYVTNRDNTAWIVERYGAKWPFDCVVLDESSSFKSHQAQRWKKLKAVRKYINRVIELTGTPASQGYLDLWPQVFLLDGGQRLGKTITSYRDAFFVPDQRNRTQIFSWKLREGAKEQIDGVLADLCISMRSEDYIKLPDLIENDIQVALDPKADKAYRQMERDSFMELGDSVVDAGTAAVLTNKLLQLANGAVYDEDKKVVHIHDCKIEALQELIEGLQGEPALVFYNYQHDRDRILKAIHGAVVFEGDVEATRWNSGEIKVLLAHPASCAYGLNLQAGGRHVVWFGLQWSLELVQQANARLHRQGQDHPVVVHRLIVQGTVDEAVVGALNSKDRVQEALLTALREKQKELI